MASRKEIFVFIINTLNKLGALFCFVASIFTVGFAIIFNESLLSDDPYIIGWAAACFVIPGYFLYYLFEKYNFKKINKNRALSVYAIIILTYFLGIYLSGGEGSEYGVLLAIIFSLALTISYLVLKYIEKKLVRNLFWSLGLIYSLGFISWFFRH